MAPSVSQSADPDRLAQRQRGGRPSGTTTTASSFEQAYRAIDACLCKEAGCGTELDYTEQTSWLLFLKYLDGLRDFVNQRLYPYLERFKQRASGPNTIEYRIGEIFGEIRNKISSGYNLRDVIDVIDGLRFRS